MSYIEEIKGDFKIVKVYEAVTVTPHIAREILGMNEGNRPLSHRMVRHYAAQMNKKQWKYTGDTIKISKTGRLLDGQHRLNAIAQSGFSQKYNIQTGLSDEIFDVLDTGKGRTAADALAIKGHTSSTTLSGAIKLVYTYERKQMGRSDNVEKFERATNHDVATWEEYHNIEMMKECVEAGGRFYSKIKLFSPATYAGFCYLFARKNKEQAFDFFTKLSTGEDISATQGSPIYVLRQKMINLQIAGKRASVDERYALLIKAWNAYREGTVIKRISWGDDEAFPKIK